MARKKRTKADQQIETFELEDVDGELHTYDVALHPGSEGQQISARLASMLSPVLIELAQSFTSSDLSEEDEMGELLEEADTGKLAQELRTTLPELGSDEFRREIFQYTQRDGEDIGRKVAFDQAYRGNYGELWQATWRVIKANRFLHSLRTFMN